VPPPPPPLPDYGASASALAMVAPSSPLFPVIAPTSPGEGRGASVPAGQAVCAAAQSSAAPPSTLVAARARTAPPAVPQKRSRPDFGSDAEHEAFKQDRRKAQKRVQEYGRAVRDRSARARPAEQRQQRAKQQAREEAREEAAARKAAAAPHVPQPLLQAVRDMWQHFGWLRSDKLRREFEERRNEPGSGRPVLRNPWLDALPSELRAQVRGEWYLKPARERLLPRALGMVREERRAARLSILDRAPKRAAWQRVSGPRADGRRVVRS